MTQPQVISADQLATAATRHLSAGTYLDREFRDKVLSEVRHNPARRVPPSYGFDVVPVVQQAWWAWWLETIGQASMLAVVAIALAVDANAVITAGCAGGICYLGRLILRHAPETLRLRTRSASARWLRRTLRGGERDRQRELSRRLVLCAAGCVVLWDIGDVAATSRGSLAGGVLTAAVVLLLLVFSSAAVGAVQQVLLNRTRSASSLRPTRLGRRLSVIDQQQCCDYVVYRKPQPDEDGKDQETSGWDWELTRFAGGGMLVHRWLPPLSVQLLRPGNGSLRDREYQRPPFHAHELVEHLKEAMMPVGHDDDPTRLRGFRVRDRLYVAETEVSADRDFLRRGRCSDEEINRVIDDPHDTFRHYLEIQVSSEGEVVTNIFLRVTVRGRTLSLDFAACALTRTPFDYQVPDQYAQVGTNAVVRAGIMGVVGLPQALGSMWRLSLVPLVLTRSLWAAKDRTVIPRRGRLIGSKPSIREETADPWDDSDLDKITIYDEMKIVEQRLLKATEDFLDDRNVDTSILKRRVFSIINTGVLNMGKLEMTETAVGTGAQLHHTAAGPAGSESPSGDGATQ